MTTLEHSTVHMYAYTTRTRGGVGSRAGIFIKICIIRRILCQFQPFLRRSFILISLKSGPLRARFCQFAQSPSLFVSRSAITLEIKVRSRAKSDFKERCAQLCNLAVANMEKPIFSGSLIKLRVAQASILML